MQDPALKNQSRGRPLTEAEATLAADLESIYERGIHDFAVVVDELNKKGTRRPSGDTGAWTLDVFEAELKAINASHDAAYEENGIGA
ncbi:recombinase-like helix-turn-helix domain-containing protein [Amorphus sp. 3PC139-8]|uniref:recombinase-like helix-turn-helix domain-containing protein n=1 Tax=Amorphus sp. 3PC139-8 TaxID=2735676 RepID=UPI00345D20C4